MGDADRVQGLARRSHAVPPVVQGVVVGAAHEIEAYRAQVGGKGRVREHVTLAIRDHGREKVHRLEDDLEVGERSVRPSDRLHHGQVLGLGVDGQGPAHDGVPDQGQGHVPGGGPVGGLRKDRVP